MTNDTIKNSENSSFNFPPPTEEEQLIAQRLIKAGNRDIQKPLEIFSAAAARLAEKIYQDRGGGENGEWHPMTPGAQIRKSNCVFTSALEVHANLDMFFYEWKSFLASAAEDKTTPEGNGITELLRDILDLRPDSEKEKTAYKRLYHFLSDGNEYASSWSPETAQKLFSDLKKCRINSVSAISWHMCCLNIYEYFCLKHDLIFHHFRNLYFPHVELDDPFAEIINLEKMVPYFTAYAVRYPSAFTKPFEYVLDSLRKFSRPICDTEPFSADDPWLEKRLRICGEAALHIIRDGSLKKFRTQRDVFHALNSEQVQNGEDLHDDAAEAVYRDLCSSYQVRADPEINPWKHSHLYAVWSMDDGYHNRPIKQSQLMSRIVPFIDRVNMVNGNPDAFKAELSQYFLELYPYDDIHKVGMDLSEAANALDAIVRKYLPSDAAIEFIRSIMEIVVPESSPGEDILKAIMDRGTTYTCRCFCSAADARRTSAISHCLQEYFPVVRADNRMKKKVQAHVLLQRAIYEYTQSMPVAYHILTERNAQDLISEFRLNAMLESILFVKRRIYAILCEMDGMPRYLTGECYLTKAD